LPGGIGTEHHFAAVDLGAPGLAPAISLTQFSWFLSGGNDLDGISRYAGLSAQRKKIAMTSWSRFGAQLPTKARSLTIHMKAFFSSARFSEISAKARPARYVSVSSTLKYHPGLSTVSMLMP
jgi:hypothetical protein